MNIPPNNDGGRFQPSFNNSNNNRNQQRFPPNNNNNNTNVNLGRGHPGRGFQPHGGHGHGRGHPYRGGKGPFHHNNQMMNRGTQPPMINRMRPPGGRMPAQRGGRMHGQPPPSHPMYLPPHPPTTNHGMNAGMIRPPPPPPPPPGAFHHHGRIDNNSNMMRPRNSGPLPTNNMPPSMTAPIIRNFPPPPPPPPNIPRQQPPPPFHATQKFPLMQQPPLHGTALTAATIDPRQQQQQRINSTPTMIATTTASQPSQYSQQPQQHTQEQIDQAWTEYAPTDGKPKYYYNPLLSISTYDKPDAIKRRDGSVTPSSTVATVATSATTYNSTSASIWREYIDGATGKKYYSDGKTTTWEKPANFQENREATTATTSTTSQNANSNNLATNVVNESPSVQQQPVRKKRKVSSDISFSNKEEAVAAFKGLLLAKEISPSMKWNDVVKLCSADARWSACEDVLSTGERKQAMAEYQTKRANELRILERQEKSRAKEAFMQMLSDNLHKISGFSAWTSRFADVRTALAKDDRFHAVATEDTRESLFLDFCEESRKREERKKRNKKRETKDAFLNFLKDMEENGILTFASTWNSFMSSLPDDAKSDTRFITSALMSDADRQLYFADFVIELQTAEDDKRSRIRDARRRAEKAQCEAFEEALRQLAIAGRITPATRWRHIEEEIFHLPSYGPVSDQGRDTPREIFEDFVGAWSDIYRNDRMLLSQLVFPKTNQQLVVTEATTLEEFTKALLEAASGSPDMYNDTRKIINRSEPVSSAQLYLRELMQEAKGINGSAFRRRGSASRRLRGTDSSSEDEGEIVEDEDGEVK